MASIIAINDNGALCNNARFKECKISFKDKNTKYNVETDGKLKTSQLIKPIYVKIKKGDIICICNGFIPKKKKVTIATNTNAFKEKDEYEDIELEAEFANLNLQDAYDEKQAIEDFYQKEKRHWAQSGMNNNSRLREAVSANYDCDEEYCQERMSCEYPGFFMVNHKTFFWKAKYPSEDALYAEKLINRNLLIDKERYNTYTRIVLLESRDGINCNDIESILIYNYLSKFEIIAPITTLPQIYRRQTGNNGE